MVAALVFVSGSAHGQASLTFSGGNGSPFSLTLNQPIEFLITTSLPAANGPYFVFQNVGNLGSLGAVSGTITFTINGGPSQTINSMQSGIAGGAIGPNDVFIFGTATSANAGDAVRLLAGTLTTTGNVAAAPPSNGIYNAIVTDNDGTQHSGFGVAVPEPQSGVLLLVGGLSLLFLARTAQRSR